MLSGRDEGIVRETVNRVQSMPLRTDEQIPRQSVVLPKLGKARRAIAARQKGQFILQANLPDQLEDASTIGSSKDTLDAYAICSMGRGDFALLHRCSGQGSGGFWAAMPCGGTTEEPEFECDEWEGGTFRPPNISITGLEDTDEDAFDGWAARVKGTHRMEYEQSPTTLAPTCGAFVVLQVPDNSGTDSGYPRGPLRIDFSVTGAGIAGPPYFLTVALLFQAGRRFGEAAGAGELATATYPEGAGVNEFHRNAQGQLREDSYGVLADGSSQWRTADATSNYQDLLDWLANGRFEVYP